MSKEVRERYKICLECLKKRLPKKKNIWDKNTALVEKVATIVMTGKAKKWYNPINGTVDVCKLCKYSNQHRLNEDKNDNVTYLRY